MSDIPENLFNELYGSKKDRLSYIKELNELRQRTPFKHIEESHIVDDLFEGHQAIELSETTPLLSSSVAGTSSATAAAAATGGSSLSTGLTLAAGLATAGAIGGIYSAVSNSNNKDNKHKRPFITLPDHNYLGPGNSIDSGAKPIDKDDLGAFNHDLDYAKANTVEEVREADREHILNSVDDILTGDIHSIISGAGIAGKYGVESLTGVKYPFSGT